MKTCLLFILVVGALGCSNAFNSDPDSKDGNGGTPPTSTISIDERLSLYGTTGPLNQNPKSPLGNAHCELSDIRTDDLGDVVETTVADGSFGSEPVADLPGRCGDDIETLSWRFHNCERFSRNLSPLACDLRLVWVSRQHTNDMEEAGFFDHTGSDGKSPFDRMAARGIGFRGAAENIVLNNSVEGAHYGWMDSQGHRDNILGDYRYVGVGGLSNGRVLLTAGFIN